MNEKELRQLQTALKNTQGVTWTRKAPRQLGLFVDFKGYQYRIDYIEEQGWYTKIAYVEGPDLAELKALVPVILGCQQDKEAEAIAKAESEKAEAEKAKAEAIGAPPSECMDENLEEEIDPETWEHFKLIQCIRTLASSLGAEAVVSTEGIPIFTNQALARCSMPQLEFIFGKLTELSQFVGADNSEPIPDSELSEDEREANAYGAEFVADFLGGDGAIAPAPGEKIVKIPAEAKTGKSLAFYQIVEEEVQ